MDTLLEEIQSDAIDDGISLASLLRKCRVLAQRIGSDELKGWTMSELDGYPDEDSLPSYRVLKRPLIFGDFNGSFGASMPGVRIPESSLREPARERLSAIRLRGSVAELEQIFSNSKGLVSFSVPPEACSLVELNFVRSDFVLYDLRVCVDRSALKSVLDTIRNKILNFSLELGDLGESSGDSLAKLKADKKAEIHQQVVTNIYGNIGNFTQGDKATQTYNQKGDLEALRSLLETQVIEPTDAEEILQAVKSDSEWLGPRTKAVWAKLTSGTIKVGSGVASNLIASAIKAYYGMPPE